MVGTKPESGQGFSACCSLWNAPSQILAVQGFVLLKSSLASLEAFSVFLCDSRWIHQLSGKSSYQNNSIAWDTTMYCLPLSCTVCVSFFFMCLIALITCWDQIRSSPIFPKARVPFIAFQCDAVFSLPGFPSEPDLAESRRDNSLGELLGSSSLGFCNGF